MNLWTRLGVVALVTAVMIFIDLQLLGFFSRGTLTMYDAIYTREMKQAFILFMIVAGTVSMIGAAVHDMFGESISHWWQESELVWGFRQTIRWIRLPFSRFIHKQEGGDQDGT